MEIEHHQAILSRLNALEVERNRLQQEADEASFACIQAQKAFEATRPHCEIVIFSSDKRKASWVKVQTISAIILESHGKTITVQAKGYHPRRSSWCEPWSFTWRFGAFHGTDPSDSESPHFLRRAELCNVPDEFVPARTPHRKT